MSIPKKLTGEVRKHANEIQLGPKKIPRVKVSVAKSIPSESAVLIGLDNGFVAMWYLPGSQKLNPYFLLGEHRGPVTAVADLVDLIWNSNRRLLASGGADSTSKLE